MGITKRLKKKTSKEKSEWGCRWKRGNGTGKKKEKNGRVPRWVWYTRFALPLE
jgi:hypothetical protein